MTVLVHRHYYNPVDKAILWTFWMQFLYHFGIKLKFLLTNLVYIHLIYLQRQKIQFLILGFGTYYRHCGMKDYITYTYFSNLFFDFSLLINLVWIKKKKDQIKPDYGPK